MNYVLGCPICGKYHHDELPGTKMNSICARKWLSMSITTKQIVINRYIAGKKQLLRDK